MRSRRAFVILDGGASSEITFQLLLDLAAPMSVQTINCVLVDSGRIEAAGRIRLLCGSGENAFNSGGWPRHLPHLWEPFANSDHRASRLLMTYRKRTAARRIQLSGEHRPDLGADAIIQLSGEYDLVFYGLSRGWHRTLPGLSPGLAGLISRGTRPVVLSHPSCSSFKRIVVAMRIDDNLNKLLQIGAAWSNCLNLPLTIISAARTNRHLVGRLDAVSRAMASLGIAAQMIGCLSGPARLAEELVPTDLLLMGAYGRPWPVELCFGSHTEDLVRKAPCPITILPARFGQSDCNLVVGESAICNN